ncbi:MAG: ABC transporter permease [Bacteroidota bacterium]
MSKENITKRTIAPRKGFRTIDFREFYAYKDLIYYMVNREIMVRYRQTFLGAVWVLLQPFISMVVFSVFFWKMAKMPSDNYPYPLFCYPALLVWFYFSSTVSFSSNSLVNNSSLITKVFFPRIIIPTSMSVVGLIDFCVSLIMMFGVMTYYSHYPTFKVFFLVIPLALLILTASGIGYFFSALNVKYRDVKYTVPFIIQLWMYVSPVVYPLSIVPERYRLLYALNPIVGIIEGFRFSFLQSYVVSVPLFLISATVGLSFFAGGTLFFARLERKFADII